MEFIILAAIGAIYCFFFVRAWIKHRAPQEASDHHDPTSGGYILTAASWHHSSVDIPDFDDPSTY